MERIKYETITGMHFEATTKCGALCAMCGRNFKGKVRENLPLTELTLNDCKQIFEPNFIKQLQFISICGVYGDPIYASEIIEIIDYFYKCNGSLTINFYTNGSIHSRLWWGRLAKSIKRGYVIFGIDGIGETHSIHRCNTDYYKVIENAKSYIDAGGKAKWDFIVFRHNEHQIDTAREISEKLGFSSFQLKKTSRFFKQLYEEDSQLDSTFSEYGKHPIFNPNGEIIDYLELPHNKKYVNHSEEQLLKLIKTYGSLENYFNRTRIDCQAINTKGVFVSALGEVYPCCTVYQQVCYGSIYNVQDDRELNEYKIYKNCNLSAFDHSIKEIIEGDFFNQLQNNWFLPSLKAGKPKSCCRSCGVELNMHMAQHTDN